MKGVEGKRKYLLILLIALVIGSVIGNFTEKTVRLQIEKVYGIVMGKPMVYDITQTDEKGIPFLIEGTIGKQRNPMTICNKALAYFDNYQKGDSSQRQLFINCADWLAGDTIHRDSFAVLKYNYNWAYYNMIAPWRSGLANGVSLQVFIRAHQLTKDEKYLSVAKQIVNSFYVEVDSGGVTYKSADEGWWFEEFADEGGNVSRVLNGHMFAMLGIHEYGNYAHDSTAKVLFNNGLIALRNNIAKYDNENGHSFYDQRGTLANLKYQKIHVDLLSQIHKISGDNTYKFYSDKWKEYDPSLTKRLISPPIKPIDVAVWLVNVGIVFIVVWIVFVTLFRRSSGS